MNECETTDLRLPYWCFDFDNHMCSKHSNKNIISKAVILCQQKPIFTSKENVNVNVMEKIINWSFFELLIFNDRKLSNLMCSSTDAAKIMSENTFDSTRYVQLVELRCKQKLCCNTHKIRNFRIFSYLYTYMLN